MVRARRSGTSRKILLAVGAVVVVAAALALYFTHRGGGGGLASCEGDVAVVYLKGSQDKLAELMARQLSQQLSRHNVPGKVCLVASDSLGSNLRLPAYPALLVRGRALSLFSGILLNESIQGWRLVRFDYVEPFAAQLSLVYRVGQLPVYTRTATLLVVNGNTPFTRVNLTALEELLREPRYQALFSAMFVANITGVKLSDTPPSNTSPRVLPAFYAVSDSDLAAGSPSVRRVAENVYATDLNVAAMLAGSRVLKAFEVRGPPNVAGHPSLGSGGIHIAIFEDFACPICAMFYAKVMPALIGYAENNTVTIHFMDLIVHNTENVTKAHRTLLCLYSKTGNSTLYYQLVSKLYKTLNLYASKGSSDKYLSWLGSFTANISERYGVSGECEASSLVDDSTRQALSMGIMGTPGFAIWREGWEWTIVVTGYHDLQFFREVISWLESHP